MGTVPSIASYRDLVAVGRGGFGTVYQAVEDRFGRKVAIKVIRDAGVGRDVVARFERECLALGSLSGHPNIVSVHDQGVTDDVRPRPASRSATATCSSGGTTTPVADARR